MTSSETLAKLLRQLRPDSRLEYERLFEENANCDTMRVFAMGDTTTWVVSEHAADRRL